MDAAVAALAAAWQRALAGWAPDGPDDGDSARLAHTPVARPECDAGIHYHRLYRRRGTDPRRVYCYPLRALRLYRAHRPAALLSPALGGAADVDCGHTCFPGCRAADAASLAEDPELRLPADGAEHPAPRPAGLGPGTVRHARKTLLVLESDQAQV